ncbi:GNAT family N-acetyltransferase [Streptomyces sioyaensis]|uniref:GNAT family N-acetyltransferase n=1 Tax=Streptomyces sioyaensis TaxID=67364 RepID=UPI0037A00C99
MIESQLMKTPGADALRIRLAEPNDLEHLPDLQLAAGEAFRGIGMAHVADNPPLSIGHLAKYQRVGQAWVGVDHADNPMGFVIVDMLDGCAHIEQISVHPVMAGRGLGRRLIDHVACWAVDQGLPALTLSTFRTVPWNAPYYLRLGFQEVEPSQITNGLRTVLDAEAAFGLDPSTRVCMRRWVRQAP